MRSRTKIRHPLKDLRDIVYTTFPPRVAGAFMSTLLHWGKHKGWVFVVQFLKDLKTLVTKPEALQGKTRGPFKTARAFLRGEMSRVPPQKKHRCVKLVRLSKAASLFKAEVSRADYVAEIERVAQDLVFNDELAYNLLTGWSKPTPQKWRPMIMNKGSASFQRAIRRSRGSAANIGLRDLSKIPSVVYNNFDVFNYIYNTSERAFFANIVRPSQEEVMGSATLLTDDGAFKKRLIFSPHFAIQLCLERLYQELEAHARTLRSFALWDIPRAVRWIKLQPHLWSIDLEAATDFIPLTWQEHLLTELFPHRSADISLFGEVSRGAWSTPAGLLKLHVGQPMGLKPSFLAFSITLYYLLKGVTAESNFRVLGDDLITSSPEVLPTLLSLGLKVNMDKTYIGQNKEWGGTVVMDDFDLETRRIKQSHAIMSLIQTRGLEAARRTFRRRGLGHLWPTIKFLASMPAPYGLGLNPKVLDQLPSRLVYELYSTPELVAFSGNLHPDPKDWGNKLKAVEAIVASAVRAAMLSVEYGNEFMPGQLEDNALRDLAHQVCDAVAFKPYVWSKTSTPGVIRDVEVEVPIYRDHFLIVANLLGLSSFELFSIGNWSGDSIESLPEESYETSVTRLLTVSSRFPEMGPKLKAVLQLVDPPKKTLINFTVVKGRVRRGRKPRWVWEQLLSWLEYQPLKLRFSKEPVTVMVNIDYSQHGFPSNVTFSW